MHLTVPQIPEPLKIWEKLEIYTGDDLKRGMYFSRIEDFHDDKIIIAPPEYIKGRTLLKNKEKILVWVTKHDAVYQFAATINQNVNGDEKQYYLSDIKYPKRIQRREFARISYATTIKYAIVDKTYNPEKIDWKTTKTYNISGNGMLIEVVEDIQEGMFLMVKSEIFSKLNIKQPILAKCYRTVYVDKTYLAGIGLVRAEELDTLSDNLPLEKIADFSGNFTFLMQERIGSFVFHYQVEMKKKGVL